MNLEPMSFFFGMCIGVIIIVIVAIIVTLFWFAFFRDRKPKKKLSKYERDLLKTLEDPSEVKALDTIYEGQEREIAREVEEEM